MHEGVGGPQTLLQFFAGYQFTRVLQQDGQDLEGLASFR
jgi:hypothetical protein